MTLQFGFGHPNQRFAFGKYDRLAIDSLGMRPVHRSEDGWIFTLEDGSGCSQSYTHQQLSKFAAQGRLSHQIGHFLPQQAAQRLKLKQGKVLISELPTKTRIAFAKRDAWVNAFLECQKDKMKVTDASIRANMHKMRALAQDFAKRSRQTYVPGVTKTIDFFVEPSPRTLRRWLAAYKKLDTHGLIDRIAARGNRGHRMAPREVSLMMEKVFGYMSPERPAQDKTAKDVQAAFKDENERRAAKGEPELCVPSYATICRAIRSLDPFQVAVARHGIDYARKKFAPVGNGLELTRPLERVDIDEHRVDAITLMASAGLEQYLTPEELEALGLDGKNKRWLITVAICATTRCIVGMTITREAKGSAATQVLQMIVQDKGKWANSVAALGSWDMHGRPEKVVTDNGPAFISEVFRHACSDLGVVHEFTPPATPEQRARIERLFRTVSTNLMRRLSGHTFSSIMEKGDANPQNRAALNFEDFAFALVRWIVDIYHNLPNEGLHGETPLECWRRLLQGVGVAPAPSNREFRLIFGERFMRRLDKSGVTVLGLRYHSEALATWMLRNDEAKVEVAWHPRDIGAILVRLDGKWIEVPALDHRFHGKAAQTWLIVARKLKSMYPRRKEFDHDTIFAAFADIDERNSQAVALAGLLVEDWSKDKLKSIEDRLFVGFRASIRSPHEGIAAADGEAGQSIPAPRKEGPSAAVAPKKRKSDSANWGVEDSQ
ncbi:DDE-type integrase/transposase/recombinase [Phaeovulum sp. NW3]|uniref:DDE-type integrase/transposase/recombinase n=1 Tax=Phaeovulum sp. NW3 TaxID=2934933 RepID=UPI002020A2BD|nr:DDE-type integrase/transposase/recombinase [Phaeovulum sp. NW3]MCL7466745.1 DDE-type integrase/transposase/recombinase [Phaeovulum sp. NW3]